MINKIKDKQTGEYHDIGNLKCKLVAEGTLEMDNNYAPTFYDLEEGKAYLLSIEIDSDVIYMSSGLCKDGVLNTSLAYEEWVGSFLFISYSHGGMEFRDISDSGRCPFSDENVVLKIYELPFALEV